MIILAIGLLGLLFGSFVNAFVWRLHEQSLLQGKKTKKALKQRKDLSISKGRSMCVDCHHELAAKDLIPVLSWVSLGGKCRYCRQPISWQYPLVELLTSGLFVLSYVSWSVELSGVGLFQFIVWLFFIIMFMALAIYDMRWLLLPDRVVYPLIIIASIEVVVAAIWGQSFAMLWQSIVGGLIIFGLFFGLFQYSGGTWIGGGDVKIAFVLGLLAATPLKAFLVIFFASLIGTIVGLPMLIKGKQGLQAKIPFGPYLLLATFIVVLYGQTTIDWYRRMLLI